MSTYVHVGVDFEMVIHTGRTLRPVMFCFCSAAVMPTQADRHIEISNRVRHHQQQQQQHEQQQRCSERLYTICLCVMKCVRRHCTHTQTKARRVNFGTGLTG